MIVDVQNVSHGFGARRILENVSFKLNPGEHIGLVWNLHFLKYVLIQNHDLHFVHLLSLFFLLIKL